MKHISKRLCALLLAAVLLLGALPLGAAAAADYSRFVGKWYYEEIVTPDGPYSPYSHYTNLTIHSITDGKVKFDLQAGRSFQGPGPSRIAQCTGITSQPITNGKANFTYKDDGWGNRGHGTITFRDDGITYFVETDKVASGANASLSMLQNKDVLLKMDGFVPGPIITRDPEGQTPFQDVYTDDWYVEAVRYAYAQGLFKGTTDTTFSPNNTMTRVQLVQVLANRTQGYSADIYGGGSLFNDVEPGTWGVAPINWAYQKGIAGGTGSGTFSPNNPLTREQLAVFLYNYAVQTGADLSPEGTAYNQFSDQGAVSPWAQTAMRWAVNKGIIKGSGGKMNPGGTATRAEVAQMFLNAKDVLVYNTIEDATLVPPTDNLKDKVDAEFVMNVVGAVAGPSTFYTRDLSDLHWYTLCTTWARGLYFNQNNSDYGLRAATPLTMADLIQRDDYQMDLTTDCMDKAIQLLGGDPAVVLPLVGGTQSPDFPVERFYPTDSSLVWVYPQAGFDATYGFTVRSLANEGSKAVLEYEYVRDPMGFDAPAETYICTVTLAPASNALGYQIESFSAKKS